MVSRSVYRSLYFQVLVAIALGVLLGQLEPSWGVAMKPLADGFIRLIKMLIAPLIFCSVVTGIAGAEDMKRVGRTGGYALLYFEVMSTVALILGMFTVNLLRPGDGMHVDARNLDAHALNTATRDHSLTQLVMDVIPETVVGAFAKGDVLPVLLFSVLSGFALHGLGGRETKLFNTIDELNHMLFRIVGYVMRLAPIGAFGAMAATIGGHGAGTLLSLAKLMATFYATCLLFVFGVLGLVARLHGFSLWKFLRYVREELLIVLGTSSSESVLPRMLDKLEKLGARKSVVGLVLPTGYSFNLDGTSIYLTMAALFVAQATDTALSLGQQLSLLLVLLLSSKGAAGVTGSGFIVLAATLSAVGGIPVAGLALILGIDRFMSEARALTNLVGNGVATLVVAKWTGALDEARMQRELSGATPEPAADSVVAEGA